MKNLTKATGLLVFAFSITNSFTAYGADPTSGIQKVVQPKPSPLPTSQPNAKQNPTNQTKPAQPQVTQPAQPQATQPAQPVATEHKKETVIEKTTTETKHTEVVEHTDDRWWHVGPSLGINLPRPVLIGVQARFFKHFGAEINYGFLPELTVPGKDIKGKLNAFDFFNFKVFPFGGSFFVGGAFGKLNIDVSATQMVSGAGAINIIANANRTYFTPGIGWRWGGTKGLFLGLDLGVMLSLSTTTSISDNTPAIVQATTEYTTQRNQINEVINDYKDTPLPHFTLIQIGYLF